MTSGNRLLTKLGVEMESAAFPPSDNQGGARKLNVTRVQEAAPSGPGGRGQADRGGPKGSEFSVRRVRPAYEQVAQQLQDLITAAELLPGQRLPSEADLAALFGVGRTTIREGLRLLSSQQLLTTTRGVHGGTFVVTPDADNISRYMETSIGLLHGTNRLTIAELLEARVCLELPAVRLATERLNETKQDALAATIQFGPESNVRMEHANFHVAIVQAAGNRMLEVMARPIFDVLRLRLNRAAAPPDFWEKVIAEHREIYQSVIGRNQAQATRQMASHLDHLASVYTAIDFASQSGKSGSGQGDDGKDGG
jgi:GntR family transcriptional regulator, transcriptional repressor for pyruvate dehydrogenase complex